MRRVTLLGATGSVGQSTINLIAGAPEVYDVVALTGGRNVEQLARDAISLNANVAVTAFPDRLDDLRELLHGTGIDVAAGHDAVIEAAERPADWVMSAIVGAAGLEPGLAALSQGHTVALANKESLVCAGPMVMQAARDHKATLLPVDSEHSAIFQALRGEDIDTVERVVITASGGAFRDWPTEKLAQATAAEAATHPNWDMGQRITIDSASLFNKAMEVIEAKEFFGFTAAQLEVVIHPQSLVHALVGFRDGALMAHLGPPDMRHAIGYALHWPERADLPVERLDLLAAGTLSFQDPDELRHPALRLARAVMETGGLAGCAFCAAKEQALDAFIDGQIGFLDMAAIVEIVLSQIDLGGPMSLDAVRHTDHEARRLARSAISKRMAAA
ncbi:MAG: 1-deoxy-D-xylulose-5-phosphate reductoisomerase [Pseudomonadota bacterium]